MSRDRHFDRAADGDRFPDEDLLDGMIDDVATGGPVRPHADAGGPGGQDALVAALSRVNALADEPLPDDVRAQHLVTIRTAEPAAGRGHGMGSATRWPVLLRRRLAPVAVATTALMLVAAGGTVAVAQDADPDDTLYGVKRASEQVWAAIPRGSERAAAVHLTLAQRRLGEARRAPRHAERLVAEGVADAEQAAEELPDEAVETLSRLLGDGEGRLPAHASPAARAALHRNCVKIAAKRGLDDTPCGPAPAYEHPGRGRGLGPDKGGDGEDTQGPRGWGPGGRPEGEVGPPPHSRGWGPGGRPDGDTGPRGKGHGWGPGGRPEGEVGPPPGAPGWGPDGRPEGWVGPPPGVPGRGPAPRDGGADPPADD